MRTTVNRTLAEALSENVVTTDRRACARWCRQDADALGLGVEVLGFTVGGMHPPVPVAADYQAVVSAELGKVTAVVNAQAFRNQTRARRRDRRAGRRRTARAPRAPRRSRRRRAKPGAFARWNRSIAPRPRSTSSAAGSRRSRRRSPARRFTVVDARFQRDGGELWVMP